MAGVESMMSQEVPLTAKEKIDKSKVALLTGYPFWATLLLRLHTVESDDIATCGVDGRTLFYNKAFIEATPRLQIPGILVHEIAHCMFMHMVRRGHRDQARFNAACDFAINALILKQGDFRLPDWVLYRPEFEGMSAEQIYEKLPIQPQDLAKFVAGATASPVGKKGNPANANGGTLDDHSLWDKPGQGPDGDKQQNFDPILWGEYISQAAIQARAQGQFPAGLESLVQTILQPKLDWRQVLREFVTESARNNHRLFPANKKHLWRSIYLPSITGSELHGIVGIDTSGSMSDADLSDIVAEVRGICEQFDDYELGIIQCDAAVQGYQVITSMDGEVPSRMKGRGGTDFRPVFEFIREHELEPNFLIYATDLYGTYPEVTPEYPVLWLVTSKNTTQPPFGIVIQLHDD